MSAFFTKGRPAKTAAVLGLVLAGALSLSACSPAAKQADQVPSSSANENPKSAPIPEPPSGGGMQPSSDLDTAGFFDNSKEFGVNYAETSTADTLTLLTGGVSRFKDSNGDTTVGFTAYKENNEGDWTFKLPKPEGDPVTSSSSAPMKMDHLRWEGKSYVVVYQLSQVNTSASGLDAGSSASKYVTYVIDAETGKLVNTLKSTLPSDSSKETNELRPVSYPVEVNSNRNSGGNVPFLNALVSSSQNGYVVVNPLTGEVIDKRGGGGDIAYATENGFMLEKILYPEFDSYASSKLYGKFGNYLLMTRGDEVEIGVYDKKANTKRSLFNATTGELVSEMQCGENGSGINVGNAVYSPNFRYVSFDGAYVFDTETDKTFCGEKTETRSGFSVRAIDNDGNLYGTNDSSRMLKVSIEDGTVIDMYDTQNKLELKGFTPEGYGIFPQGQYTFLLPPTKK